MSLLDLPSEILSSLPLYVRNIEDFVNLASTCHTLRNAFTRTYPNTILRLADASAPTFFGPHPHFLVMATASQISQWAIGDEQRTIQLKQAMQGGIGGLYDLCLQQCGLTMDRIRSLHLSRFSTINPLSDRIDKMAGSQWYDTPNFWNGGVSEPATLHTEPERAAFQYLIYGELFGTTMRAYLEPELNLPRFGLQTRLEYIKYCIPDWTCKGGYAGLEVLDVGPYRETGLPADQISLQHILSCGRWARMWEKVSHRIGPDFSEEWRQKLWWNSLQTLGLEGAYLVVEADKGISDEWKARLSRMRSQVEQLDGQKHIPPAEKIGTRMQFRASEAPEPANEIFLCMARYWNAR